MKKWIGKLIIAVESKTSATKRSSGTAIKFVNKILCNKEMLEKPTPAYQYVAEQMQEYPLPPKNNPSKRQKLLKEKINSTFQQKQKKFDQLLSKLEKRLTFLQIEEIRELIIFMSPKQAGQKQIGLKKLKNSVNYFLESSQQSTLIEAHILQAANKLLKQIRLRQAQKKRVKFIV